MALVQFQNCLPTEGMYLLLNLTSLQPHTWLYIRRISMGQSLSPSTFMPPSLYLLFINTNYKLLATGCKDNVFYLTGKPFFKRIFNLFLPLQYTDIQMFIFNKIA
jgi:hypothetical protein